MVFAAFNETLGEEPWVSDGTESGTLALADIHPAGSSSPHGFTELNDRLLFLARDADHHELWSTNATPAGTVHLKNLAPSVGITTGPMVSGEGVVFFFVETSVASELWKSNGTSTGTELVTTVGTVGPDADVAVYQGALYFSPSGSFPGSGGLWKSDGTTSGTVHVSSPWRGIGGEPEDYLVAGNHLFFTALTPEGRELWRTDGSAAGTILLQDIFAGPAGSDPSDLVALDDGTLFCSARSATHANGLWKSDGTPGGTTQILAAGQIGSAEGSIVGLGDQAWFVVPKASGDDELWSTDGTEIGTFVRVAEPSFTSGFQRVGSADLVVFTGLDPGPGAGFEPFVSNARAGGTVLVSDVFPGIASSGAGGYTRTGGRIFFFADDGVHDTELHAFEISTYGGWVAEPFGSGCGTSPPASFRIEGRMLGGSNFVFELADAVPSAPVALFYSPGVTHLTVGACDYYLPQAALITIGTSDACGELSLPRTVPSVPGLIGNVVTIQALAVSTGGPFLGVGELSNPVEIVIGP